MFRQILFTNLRWTRLSLTVMSVVAFVMPAGLWRLASDSRTAAPSAIGLMHGFEVLGVALVALAAFSGFGLAAQPWAEDFSGRHVYALSLPIPWSRYVGMRFGAGALQLLLPTVALWLGCLLVLAQIELPATLHAYPVTLASRFLLGALVSYAAIFLIQYVSGRRAALTLLVVLLAVSVGMIAAEATGNSAALSAATRWLFVWPGPFAVFGADWMLIDV